MEIWRVSHLLHVIPCIQPNLKVAKGTRPVKQKTIIIIIIIIIAS